MKKMIFFSVLVTLLVSSLSAHALTTEMGLSYGRKTTTFDENNSFDSESITGSVSLYFLERLAVELSYTDARGLREEKASASDAQRTTTQKSQIMGADLILVFADKKSLLQPYIKGGGAQISRYQEVRIEGQDTFTIEPESATVPSYGAGLKVQLTDTFGIKLSYDVWKTPIGGGLQTDDSSIRAGVTWVL
ncbi:outer membrane beta-barrel protein [Bdellovibrio reynosensis]|uniref:Porin family protein n=1 Tax=Bdellovibrio reynosensis TaxID=2835041 RepID=A0ABY4C769_9BACT|nr:outer membrane beta-barrel protein [Bdellovibrio reynosensis]UOE99761.1 porin family protein [Bdellovibrio reynosensis]